MLKNRVVYILDDSGSMRSLRTSALEVFNSIISANKKESAKAKQRTEVSVVLFSGPNEFEYLQKGVNVNKVKEVTKTQYTASGNSTALLDAVGKAIENELKVDDSDDDETSFLVVVVTDGGENSSRTFSGLTLSKLIKKVQNTDRWTITFQVPRGGSNSLTGYGIPSSNIREWDQDEQGIREVGETLTSGLTNFYDSRSRGIKSVSNFYVQTDLSHLTPTKVKRELTNLSSEFGIFSAPREMQIRDFVESKTKKPYEKGQAFYQLLKKETVQADKEILVFDKTSTAVYGGDEARDLIGLPLGASATVKVGDHGNYDIFVQSNSVNRKLTDGQKIAIRI